MTQNDKAEIIVAGRFLNFVRRGSWEYVDRPNVSGIVCIAALTERDELLLVEQYRPPVGRDVIELPAGLAGDIAGEEDEPLARAAARELWEETGYHAETLTEVCRGVPSAGLSSEELTVYLARGVVKTGQGGGDALENIRVHVVPRTQLPNWLDQQQRAGKAIDLKIYTGLWALNFQP